MEGKNNEKDYVVLSIDVGVIHLGISVSILNHDYTLKEIIWVDNIDMQRVSVNFSIPYIE
jgi:purine-nucleoside phosphorylase